MACETRYVVQFRIRFPRVPNPGVLDMLRYDSCFPSSEEDSRKLAAILEGTAGTGGIAKVEVAPSQNPMQQFLDTHFREVSFIRVGRSDHGPTVRRWESFGCELVEEDHL